MKYLLIAFMLCPLFIYAWGKEGHQIIADIAQKNLNKGVEQIVQKYLGDMTFEHASIWMDENKSDHSFDYMKPWHYLNIEKNGTYIKVPEGDIVSELSRVITELQNYKKMDDKDIALDLKILFHLCGDITQPLHVGYGSDKGGNNVKVRYNNEEIKLHHFWDTDIIENEKITSDLCLTFAKSISNTEKKTICNIDVIDWMTDSRSNLPSVYNFKENTITSEYLYENKKIIETQLVKGGYRLAAVLNNIFLI